MRLRVPGEESDGEKEEADVGGEVEGDEKRTTLRKREVGSRRGDPSPLLRARGRATP